MDDDDNIRQTIDVDNNQEGKKSKPGEVTQLSGTLSPPQLQCQSIETKEQESIRLQQGDKLGEADLAEIASLL